MQWSELLGHNRQKKWFRNAIDAGRLATSFLFIGPDGIGKRTFALLLAKSLLCRDSLPQALEPCGQCEDCVQVEARTHPDLITIAKPPDRAVIPLELLIGEPDKRMREGLCHAISMRPYGGRRKIAVIDDADYFNNEGANCLLKTLEEPPSDSVMILIGTSLQRQLPTIRSRCQAVLFQPLNPTQIQTLLHQNELADSLEDAQQLANRCGGNLAEARLLAEPEIEEFRMALLETLAKPQLPLIGLVKSCAALVDAAGKDARLKRERMKFIFRLAAAFYRELAIQFTTAEQVSHAQLLNAGDVRLTQSVVQAGRVWKTGSPGATAAWNRCLVAIEQVDRNANQATLLETWVSDLAALGDC